MDLILVRLEVCLKMKKGLILQERDVELLEFLAEYKTITLNNTKYIYGTKTYQEKRICHLVKEKYLTRLTHREISLGKNGKDFLNEIGTNIKVHCRNPNNIERLKVISDIASFTNFSNTMSFIPSWYLKDKDCPTQDSRRYLGLLTFDHNFFTVYSVFVPLSLMLYTTNLFVSSPSGIGILTFTFSSGCTVTPSLCSVISYTYIVSFRGIINKIGKSSP